MYTFGLVYDRKDDHLCQKHRSRARNCALPCLANGQPVCHDVLLQNNQVVKVAIVERHEALGQHVHDLIVDDYVCYFAPVAR